MKYQKAKSIIHQFNAAKAELDRRIEARKGEHDWLDNLKESGRQAKSAVEHRQDEVNDIERRIERLEEEKRATIRQFEATIAAAKFELQAEIDSKKQVQAMVVNSEKAIEAQEAKIKELDAQVEAQERVVKRWSEDLGEAQKVMDDVKTREIMSKAAADAALKQMKEGALAELKEAQAAGKVPAEANLTEIVEKYFDRKRVFGR